jgi:hypothetical protein
MRDASLPMRVIIRASRFQGGRVASFESDQLLLEKRGTFENALEGRTTHSCVRSGLRSDNGEISREDPAC